MPFKHTEKLIPRDKQRRIKLSEDDKEEIKRLYADGHTIRDIARKFEAKCTRRNIQFVLFPARIKKCNFPGHWKLYYDKQKHKNYMKSHRRYKQKLYLAGQLTEAKA